ncbi:hypothetical protein ACFQ0B_04140 [Nonomuraea thailandensis]
MRGRVEVAEAGFRFRGSQAEVGGGPFAQALREDDLGQPAGELAVLGGARLRQGGAERAVAQVGQALVETLARNRPVGDPADRLGGRLLGAARRPVAEPIVPDGGGAVGVALFATGRSIRSPVRVGVSVNG